MATSSRLRKSIEGAAPVLDGVDDEADRRGQRARTRSWLILPGEAEKALTAAIWRQVGPRGQLPPLRLRVAP